MRLLRYQVVCQSCCAPAVYKIASRWTDDHTSELKTYALSCAECVEKNMVDALRRRNECRTDPGERIDLPEVYQLTMGTARKV